MEITATRRTVAEHIKDTRFSAEHIQNTIAQAIAVRNNLTADVASIEERLTLEYAKAHLGMFNSVKGLCEQLAATSARLETQRRIVAGLQAIDSERDRITAEAAEKQAQTERQIAESRGRLMMGTAHPGQGG